jgi:hypothetical protein
MIEVDTLEVVMKEAATVVALWCIAQPGTRRTSVERLYWGKADSELFLIQVLDGNDFHLGNAKLVTNRCRNAQQ